MNTFVKTFKSEYHFGGICRVQKSLSMLFVEFGDINNRDCLGKVIDMNNERPNRMPWKTDLKMFLEENTSSYYAEKIFDYIIERV